MTERQWLWVVLVLSSIAMLGSLYYGYFGDPFSNILTGEWFVLDNWFPPCALCWYIRIVTFPLVLISAVALNKRIDGIMAIVRPFAWIWLIFAGYNYYLEKFASSSTFCNTLANGTGPSCTISYVNYFGFVTIPFLGIILFLLILLVCRAVAKKRSYFNDHQLES